MTSSLPNRRYGNAVRRLGFDTDAATAFFDEHVEADAVHEAIASVDLAGGLIRQEPALAGDLLWGARTLAAIEGRWADQLLAAWEAGRTTVFGYARNSFNRFALTYLFTPTFGTAEDPREVGFGIDRRF